MTTEVAERSVLRAFAEIMERRHPGTKWVPEDEVEPQGEATGSPFGI